MDVSADAAAGMPASASEFSFASDRASPASNWTPEEDAVLLAGVARLKTHGEMAEMLPHRTVRAIQGRVGKLRDEAKFTVAPRAVEQAKEDDDLPLLPDSATAASSRALLLALLRYGARKPAPRGLPGLAADQFLALCARYCIAVPA